MSVWRLSWLVPVAGCHLVSGLADFTAGEGGAGGSAATGGGGGAAQTGGGAATGGGGVGGGGGVQAVLTDEGLIARWFLDDPDDGGGTATDQSGNMFNLDFEPQGNAMTFSFPATGRGIEWMAVGDGGRLSLVSGTVLLPTLNNRTTLMIEMVMGPLAGDSAASRLFYVGETNADGHIAITANTNFMDLRLNTMAVGQWPLEPLNGRAVHHLCVDLGAPVPDAIRAYIDGVPRTDEMPPPPSLPSAITLTVNSSDVLVGNGNNDNLSPQGRIGYVALYDACLPETVIAGHAQRLLASDDP